MMEKALSEILKSSNLCNGLTQKEIENLVGRDVVRIKKYKRNDILFWTDDPPEKLYILVSGDIAMARDTVRGKRSLSKSNTTPGELIGEVRLFSPRQLLWEYAIALEDSTVLEIESGIFIGQGIIDTDLQVVLLRNIIGSVVRKIDKLGQKVRILSITSARERIAFYLLSIQDENRRMILNATREEIADYLGMARPSLSRELGRMQDEGIIRIDDREVHIVNQADFDELFE